jgi:hypothetical protein
MVFNRDPQVSVTTLPQPREIRVHLSSPDEIVEYGRGTKGIVAGMYGAFKRARIGQSRSFEEELGFQKLQLIREAFIPVTLLQREIVDLDSSLTAIGSIGVAQAQSPVLDALQLCGNPGAFWTSEQLMESPALHNRASLMAADIFFNPAMKTSPSLNIDFDIVASALPHVDILATDGHMADLIQKAKLLDRYDTKVVSMKERRQLLGMIKGL